MSLTVLLLFSLSTSFGTETPTLETREFLSFSAWKRSQNPMPPGEEIAQIDEKLKDCESKLEPLKKLNKASDKFWDTLAKFQIKGGNIILYLCNNHERIFWDIIDLNEEIRELKQRKKELTKSENDLNEDSLTEDDSNMNVDALVSNGLPAKGSFDPRAISFP